MSLFLIPFLAGALLHSAPQSPAQNEARFPKSTALAEELSPQALANLDELIQGFVDKDEVVGAELLVIKNGRSVLHEAYGWRDREAKVVILPHFRGHPVRSYDAPRGCHEEDEKDLHA